MKKLKVGDIIYSVFGDGNIKEKRVIDRLTKTQAISGTSNFTIDINDAGSVSMIGGHWAVRGAYTYKIETEELKKAYERRLLIERIKETSWHTLTDVQLRAIANIIEPKTT